MKKYLFIIGLFIASAFGYTASAHDLSFKPNITAQSQDDITVVYLLNAKVTFYGWMPQQYIDSMWMAVGEADYFAVLSYVEELMASIGYPFAYEVTPY